MLIRNKQALLLPNFDGQSEVLNKITEGSRRACRERSEFFGWWIELEGEIDLNRQSRALRRDHKQDVPSSANLNALTGEDHREAAVKAAFGSVIWFSENCAGVLWSDTVAELVHSSKEFSDLPVTPLKGRQTGRRRCESAWMHGDNSREAEIPGLLTWGSRIP